MSFVLSFILAILAGAVMVLVSGENPIEVFSILLSSSIGSLSAFSQTLFYSTPLIFTGLAVAIPYRLGLFNIGAEGQLYLASMGYCVAAYNLPSTSIFSVPLAIALAALFGGAWSALAGIFRAWRGSHEVITTIMLNFVAYSLASYGVLYLWKDESSQRPETAVMGASYWIPQFGGSPLNYTFVVAILAVVATWFFLEKTRLGFRMRVAGSNPDAARTAGIRVSTLIVLGMFLGGAMTAGVALNEIGGNTHRLRDGFSSGYGFIGIAVAFLGRNHPIGIFFAALFFGALFKGAADLDIETENMTRDFAVVLQAIFILAVSCEGAVQKLILEIKSKWRVRRHGKH